MSKGPFVSIAAFFTMILPVIGLSLWAYTVLHQIIILATVLVATWAAYYVGRLVREREKLTHQVFEQICQLRRYEEALNACLSNVERTDEYNEHLLETRLAEECHRSRRYARPLSFVMVDVDNIEEIKNHYGPDTANAVIQQVLCFLRQSTRRVDIMIRRRDNRIISILPETNWDQSKALAQRINYAVEKNTFQIRNENVRVVISVGFVSFDGEIHQRNHDVIESLQKAVSNARRKGRGQIASVIA